MEGALRLRDAPEPGPDGPERTSVPAPGRPGQSGLQWSVLKFMVSAANNGELDLGFICSLLSLRSYSRTILTGVISWWGIFFVRRLSRLENLKLSRIRSHKTRSLEIKIQVPNYVFNQSTRDKPRSDELQSLHRRLIEFWFELKSFSLCKEQSNEAILSHLNREFTCIPQFFPSLSFISKIEFLNIFSL